MGAMVTGPQRIADEIAGVIMGLILAGVLYLLMAWAWPEIRVPVVIVFLLSWGFTSVDTIILRRHGHVRTTPSGWRYVKWSDGSRRGMSLGERIWGDMAAALLGLVVSLFVAGVAGKLWPPLRWPVFFVLFALLTAVGVVAAAARHNDA